MSVEKWTHIIIILLLATLIISCGSEEEISSGNIEEEPDLVNQMISIAEQNSLNKNSIDWTSSRTAIHEKLENLGFRSAVIELLQILDDSHSFYLFPDGNQSISFSTIQCLKGMNMFDVGNDSIGYLSIGAFSGTDEQALKFVDDLQLVIERQDGPEIKCWVIDLSNNSGGNMYPMIAAMGPIIGDGPLGYFIDADGNELEWGYDTDGSYIQNTMNKVTRLSKPYVMKSSGYKIAVIIDKITASSGEAAAISLKGEENTLFIGNATCGLSTANQNFNLSNGGSFVLTVSTMSDRNKNIYGGPVQPDIIENRPSEIQRLIIEFTAQ